MKKSIFQSAVLLVFFLFALPAYGAQGDDQRGRVPEEFKPSTTVTQPTEAMPARSVAADRASRTAGEKKLSTDLFTLIRPAFLPQGTTLQDLKDGMKAMKQLVQAGADARVRGAAAAAPADVVYVYVQLQPDAAMHAVDDFLWKITDSDEKNKIVVAYVEVARIAKLAEQAAVVSITTVMPPLVNKVNTSEGDVIHRSDLVRALGSGSGAGIKIGLISDGVNTRSAAQATGDLPADGAGLTVLSDTVGGDEGTAMLEIVYDLVPAAQLYFHDCGANTVAFNSGIDALVAAGCKVIVDDIGWLNEPFFEQGTVGGHVASVLAANDIMYISSAGNAGNKHHQKGFTDDGSGYHNANTGSGTPYLYMHLPTGGTIKAFFEWNEAYGSATQDYDLYLTSTNFATIYAKSENQQGVSFPYPLESLTYTNNGPAMDVALLIHKYNATGTQTMEVYVYPSNGASVYSNNIVVQDSIFGHPAVPAAIAVGAIAANDPGNDAIELFSSQGPVTLLGSTVQKPDISGIDGVSVTGAGGFSNPFYGTSAAAPHIAAIAAQLWGKNTSLSRDQITSYLLNNTIDEGTAGFDTVFGYGRADAYNAFIAVPAGAATTTVATTSVATTTTTTTPGRRCPFKKAASEGVDVSGIRKLRDARLDTATGAMISSMYYQNMAEISDILRHDDALRERFRLIVGNSLPEVNALVRDGVATMTEDRLIELHDFLVDLQAQAGPLLRHNINFILWGIESGWLQQWFGITVKKQ
jgi:hypothetical protein